MFGYPCVEKFMGSIFMHDVLGKFLWVNLCIFQLMQNTFISNGAR